MPITAKGRRAAKAAAKAGSRRAAEAVASPVRRTCPHRCRRAVYLVVTKTPLKAKLSELVFGPRSTRRPRADHPAGQRFAGPTRVRHRSPGAADGTKKTPRPGTHLDPDTKDDGAAE